mmetsp:Transcript_45469/g.105444  ORF Transcript_45469/g.105444 Transcript_45469/m.105444 type:complete len:237 (-) Transcript_45469:65-775(-)
MAVAGGPYCHESVQWARQQLCETKTHAAMLETQLHAAEAALCRARSSGAVIFNGGCRQDETMHAQALKGELRSVEMEQQMLRQELQIVSRTVVARSEEAERLRNELSLALVHLTRLESETASSAALHAGLEAERTRMNNEVANEQAAASALRQQLQNKGWGLAWLRSSARSHAEDLRGTASMLDQSVHCSVVKGDDAAVAAVAGLGVAQHHDYAEPSMSPQEQHPGHSSKESAQDR